MPTKSWPVGRPSVYAQYLIEIAIEDPWRQWSIQEFAQWIHSERVRREPDAEIPPPGKIADALHRKRAYYRPGREDALPDAGDGRVLIGTESKRLAPTWYAWRWGLTVSVSYWEDLGALEALRKIEGPTADIDDMIAEIAAGRS